MLPFDSLVLHKYRILRSPVRRDGLLGKGTFGNVYLAKEELADRDVAIKELGLDAGDLESQQEEALRRFLNEGRLGLRIRHPNLLEIYAIEPYEEGYLLVMELATRGDLKALLGRGRPSTQQAVEIGAGIARGLHAAHEHGIIHRDLKPGNIFIMDNGTPKVADFGVAHIPQAAGGYLSLTRTGFQPGTVIYMSPEQASGRRIDSRSDLYSLAVILFELLTGQFYVDIQRCRELAQSRAQNTPALEELRFFQVFTEVAFEGPTARPSEKNPAIPAWLDDVVMKGLSRDPDERWQSGREFAEALLAGPAPRVSPAEQTIDATLIDQLTPRTPSTFRPAPGPDPIEPPGTAGTGYTEPVRDATIAATAAAGAVAEAEATYVKAPHTQRPAAQATPTAPLAPDVARTEVGSLPAIDRTEFDVATPPADRYARPAEPSPEIGVSKLGNGAGAASNGSVSTFGAAGAVTNGAAVAPAGGFGGATTPGVQTQTPDRGERRTRPRWLLFAVPAAVIALVAGGIAVVLASQSGGKPSPPPVIAQTQTPATVVATEAPTVATSPSPSPSPSPTPSPTPAPPRQAAAVPDAELLRPGATLVERVNIPGSNGDPGLIAISSAGQAGADGCRQPFVDLIRPQAGGKVATVWDATKAPSGGSAAIAPIQKADDGCFPVVKTFAVRPLQAGSTPLLLLGVQSSGGSQQLISVQATGDQPKLLASQSTTPGANVALQDGPPPVLQVTENAYPPESSGLLPDYSRPLGKLSLSLTAQADGLQPGAQKLTPNCTTGTITRKSSNAVEWSCPDGSPGPVAAASVSGDTSYDQYVSFDDLNAGDDITVTFADGTLAPQDPLNALPAVTAIRSSTAAARKAPTPAPTPVRTPTRTPSTGGTTGGGTTSGGGSTGGTSGGTRGGTTGGGGVSTGGGSTGGGGVSTGGGGTTGGGTTSGGGGTTTGGGGTTTGGGTSTGSGGIGGGGGGSGGIGGGGSSGGSGGIGGGR